MMSTAAGHQGGGQAGMSVNILPIIALRATKYSSDCEAQHLTNKNAVTVQTGTSAFYLVIVAQHPAETLHVRLNHLPPEVLVRHVHVELGLVVPLLPALLPQPAARHGHGSASLIGLVFKSPGLEPDEPPGFGINVSGREKA